MKDIVAIAETMVQQTRPFTQYTEADLHRLQAHRATTQPWVAELADVFGTALYNNPGTAELMESHNRQDRQAAYSVWLEKLTSGSLGDSFWAETAMIGLLHARAGVDNRHVIALASRIEAEFLARCIEVIPEPEGLATYLSFKRLSTTATALMVDCYLAALSAGMAGLGVKPGLARRAQSIGIRNMIDEARSALPLIEWSDALSVGLESIDEQHKVLIDLINELHVAHAGRRGKEELHRILENLVDYTVSHFQFEEGLMDTHGYPATSSHKAAHAALVSQVQDLVAAHKAGKAKLGGEIFQFLRSWLNGHIRGTDRLYSDFFRDRGVR